MLQQLPQPSPHQQQQGFTLLEVLLVIVLMGLIASAIAPTLPTGSGVQQLQRETDRFVALTRIARQKALMDGQSLGLSFTESTEEQLGNTTDRYQFSVLNKDKWQNLERDRLLQPVSLPDDISVSVTLGDSFWQKAIEYEGQSNSAAYVLDAGEKVTTPDIYFWSSGEVSPALITLCLQETKPICRQVEISETGLVSHKELAGE